MLGHEFPHGDSKGWIVLHCYLTVYLGTCVDLEQAPSPLQPPSLPSFLPPSEVSCWATFHISWTSPSLTTGRICRKDHFCPELKTCFVTTKRLSWVFVVTKIGLSWQMFCRDKHTFVATKVVFCRDKNDTCGSSRHWCSLRPQPYDRREISLFCILHGLAGHFYMVVTSFLIHNTE